jgi:hypothetical protein
VSRASLKEFNAALVLPLANELRGNIVRFSLDQLD